MAERAGRRLCSDELLIPTLGATILRKHLDGVTLISWELDAFAFAESYDEAAGRYRGLQVGQVPRVSSESAALLVKPEVACRQFTRMRHPSRPRRRRGDFTAR